MAWCSATPTGPGGSSPARCGGRGLFADRTWFFAAPGGETYDDVMARVSDWLYEQVAEPERRLIVVSHGIAGRLLRGAYAGLTPTETLELDVPQDALYRLQAGQLDRFDCEPVEDPELASVLVRDTV
jgi:probable phosphoglycerate mutase